MRLDIYLCGHGHAQSRSNAKFLIEEGAVTIDGKLVDKPALEVDDSVPHTVSIRRVCPYVSVGGMKLEAALDRFGFSPSGLVCADIGSSTGGFTDCLLQHGASHVYAVDSGTSQLHPDLRGDARVTVMENSNARYLTAESLGVRVSLTVCDVSFISQRLILPAISDITAHDGAFITLIKPQFELDQRRAGKGKGVISDPKDRAEAIISVAETAAAIGLFLHGITVSPVSGGSITETRKKERGNREYLAIFDRKDAASFTERDILDFIKHENSNDLAVRHKGR